MVALMTVAVWSPTLMMFLAGRMKPCLPVSGSSTV